MLKEVNARQTSRHHPCTCSTVEHASHVCRFSTVDPQTFATVNPGVVGGGGGGGGGGHIIDVL